MTTLQALDAVGPHGVYLGNPAAQSPEWTQLRRQGVTGTDVVTLAGESSDSNPRLLWHVKRGDPVPPREVGEAGKWGRLSEPMIADDFEQRTGVPVAPGGIVCNRSEPWMRAQLDRILPWCPDADGIELAAVANVEGDHPSPSCVLEIKTRNAFVAGKWRDDVPDDVLAQVAWQRRVTGLDHIHVACLIGGQRLVEHTYTEDAALEGYLYAAARRFWDQVLDDVPPEIEWDAAMSALLDILVPDRTGERELGGDELEHLMGLWQARLHAEDVAAAAKDAQDAAIKAAMGTGPDAVEVLTWQGEAVFTYRAQTKRSVRVDDALAVAPELVVESDPFRVLRGPRRDTP